VAVALPDDPRVRNLSVRPHDLGSYDKLIEEAIRETGASKKSDMGSVMKIVLSKAQGRADGGAVSKKVSAKLA